MPFVKGTGEEDFGMYVNGKPTIGYLKQVAFNNENGTMYEEVKSAYSSLLELESKMNAALARLQQDQTEDAPRPTPVCTTLLKRAAGTRTKKNAISPSKNSAFPMRR